MLQLWVVRMFKSNKLYWIFDHLIGFILWESKYEQIIQSELRDKLVLFGYLSISF